MLNNPITSIQSKSSDDNNSFYGDFSKITIV